MSENTAQRFIELVIATTIGSIVGAYIARDIEFSFNLVVRAVFAVALLSVFFFFVYRTSISWGHRKPAHRREEEVEELPEEDYPQEYDGEREEEKYPEEEFSKETSEEGDEPSQRRHAGKQGE